MVQSGDHIGRTCVVKWFKLKPSGDDVEVSAGASACCNQLGESSHKITQASQINIDKRGNQLCIDCVSLRKGTVLMGLGDLPRGDVASYLSMSVR